MVRLILGGALAQAPLGIAVGIPLALPSDPLILAGAAAVRAVCAAAAGAIPAIRAGGLDPVEALRAQY